MNPITYEYITEFVEKTQGQLTGSESRIYMWMLTHADENLQYAGSYKTLASKTNMSENGVRFSIGALVRMGLLGKLARTGKRNPTTYQLQRPIKPMGDLKAIRKEAQLAPSGGGELN